MVVTGTAFDPDTAPAKSSLETMEPQTIINKSYIEDSVAETADYTTILAIAPSMTGTDINGPGLSDGGVKNTLRGLPDGNFGMHYDGIPFGDTNGPTHHSESYFPGPTIGSIDVDRGPGNAGNMGAVHLWRLGQHVLRSADAGQHAPDRSPPAAGAPTCSTAIIQTGDLRRWAA